MMFDDFAGTQEKILFVHTCRDMPDNFRLVHDPEEGGFFLQKDAVESWMDIYEILTGCHFCPWCGKNVDDMVEINLNLIHEVIDGEKEEDMETEE